METLFELAERRINQMRYDFERYLLKEINWEHRLICDKRLAWSWKNNFTFAENKE